MRANTELSFEEFHARNIARARDLRGQRVLIVGVGTIGSHIALHLGDAGVDLILLDGDDLSIENLHRHVLTASFLNQNKATGMQKYLTSRLPGAQQLVAYPKSVEQLPRSMLVGLAGQMDAVVAATGNDETDRLVNSVCREAGTPIVVPGLWAESRPALGDVLVVPYEGDASRFWSIGCFECVHPPDANPASLQAQPGLGADVTIVAQFSAQLTLALLVEDDSRSEWLRERIRERQNYFLVPRMNSRLMPVMTRRRRGCSGCLSAPRGTRERIRSTVRAEHETAFWEFVAQHFGSRVLLSVWLILGLAGRLVMVELAHMQIEPLSYIVGLLGAFWTIRRSLKHIRRRESFR